MLLNLLHAYVWIVRILMLLWFYYALIMAYMVFTYNNIRNIAININM